jgi:hypothetical protein
MVEQRPNLSAPRALDTAERLILTVVFGYFAYKLLSDVLATGNPFSLVLLMSEAAVLAFVLLRRPTSDISRKPFEWALGFGGTLVPMLARPGGSGSLLPYAGLLPLFIVGVAIQVAAKLYLGLSFGIVPANRGVKMRGPYRFVRHPMYAGYILTQFGYLLANPTLRNLTVYDEAYGRYAARVTYRLIPGIF